jgi:putative MATE family efflux protein
MFKNNTPLFRQSVALAWPVSLQNMLVTILSMIDILMVGHLGNIAVAAVGLSNRIQFVVLIIISGIAAAVGVLASQYFGAKKPNRIGPIIIMGSISAILLLIPIVILNFLYADTVIALATQDKQVQELSTHYLWIVLPSLLFIAITINLENGLRAIGQVRLPLKISFLAIIFNILLNYWLIHGGLGIAPLGVAGAAWATVISRFLQMSLMVLFSQKYTRSIFTFRDAFAKLNKSSEWTKLVKLMLPMMLSFGVWSLGTLGYQLIYSKIGTEELAVMSLLAPVEGLLISIFFGFASASTIIVGRQLGNNNFDQAYDIAKQFVLYASVAALILGSIFILIKPLIFLPFSNLPADTLSLASSVFLVIVLGCCLKVFNMTTAVGVLRAGGDNRWCLVTDLIGMWTIGIPLTILAAFYFKWPLFWVVFTAYSEELCKAFLFHHRLKSKRWMRNLTHD